MNQLAEFDTRRLPLDFKAEEDMKLGMLDEIAQDPSWKMVVESSSCPELWYFLLAEFREGFD